MPDTPTQQVDWRRWAPVMQALAYTGAGALGGYYLQKVLRKRRGGGLGGLAAGAGIGALGYYLTNPDAFAKLRNALFPSAAPMSPQELVPAVSRAAGISETAALRGLERGLTNDPTRMPTIQEVQDYAVPTGVKPILENVGAAPMAAGAAVVPATAKAVSLIPGTKAFAAKHPTIMKYTPTTWKGGLKGGAILGSILQEPGTQEGLEDAQNLNREESFYAQSLARELPSKLVGGLTGLGGGVNAISAISDMSPLIRHPVDTLTGGDIANYAKDRGVELGAADRIANRPGLPATLSDYLNYTRNTMRSGKYDPAEHAWMRQAARNTPHGRDMVEVAEPEFQSWLAGRRKR